MAEPARPRYATEPLYNIKAVVQKTGIPADTVRAWERRYGIPSPGAPRPAAGSTPSATSPRSAGCASAPWPG